MTDNASRSKHCNAPIKTDLRRRMVLGAIAFGPWIVSRAVAQDITDLEWKDLLPEGVSALPDALRGLVQHQNAPLISQQPDSAGVRQDLDGLAVRMSGYVVPVDFQGTGVTAFLLVPYVGACIHVPPPPANQLVFVTTETPYQSSGLFEAVNVTGVMAVSSISTELALIGYEITASQVEAFPL